MQIRLISTLLALLVCPSLASAGVLMRVESTDHSTTPPEIQRTRIMAESPRVLIETPGTGAGDRVIFDANANELIRVDGAKREYLVIDQASLRELATMADQLEALIERTLAQVPAAQREQARSLIQTQMEGELPAAGEPAPSRSFRATGERRKVNGYPCARHEALQGGRVVRELWVTSWSNLDGGAEARSAIMGMSRFVETVAASLPAAAAARDPLFDRLSELGGFPVLTREFDRDGAVTREFALLSTEVMEVDPASFAPPKGYQRREIEIPALPGGR